MMSFMKKEESMLGIFVLNQSFVIQMTNEISKCVQLEVTVTDIFMWQNDS